MKAMKYVELYNSATEWKNFSPEYLVELIPWLTKLLESVPSEYHEDVLVDLTSDPDDTNVNLCIYYHRPPTQEETEREFEAASLIKQKAEENERKLYEQLKAKFDP